MKKNIGFVRLDVSLVKWIYEKLRLSASETEGTQELREGLEELMNRSVESLMLEIDGGETGLNISGVINIGDITIDPKFRKVTRSGKDISLTPKEFDILYFLARNCGEVFTKEQIYQAVWESDYLLDDSNIMAFVRKLRKKIEPNPDSPKYILTIWGIGYKFNDKF